MSSFNKICQKLNDIVCSEKFNTKYGRLERRNVPWDIYHYEIKYCV